MDTGVTFTAPGVAGRGYARYPYGTSDGEMNT